MLTMLNYADYSSYTNYTNYIDCTTRFPTVTIYFIYLFIYLGASGLHS